jgi:hypothetical protein
VTLLDAFCRRHGITTPELAASAIVSRQHTGRVRGGKVPRVTIDMAKQLAKGASRILRRRVAVGELFDLDYFCPWR